MEKVMIKLPHGYFSGGIYPLLEISPTIDAHIACWHILIGEKIEEMKCKQVGEIKTKGFTEMTGRVYDKTGISPSLRTCGGGNTEVKILDEQNSTIKSDGIVGCLTTDGSSPKHNNRVVENNYRVRKLTEKECFKLQGVKEKDFEKIRKNQSRSSCYHLAGDSITTTVLMAIFGKMFNIDYKEKIDETVNTLIDTEK